MIQKHNYYIKFTLKNKDNVLESKEKFNGKSDLLYKLRVSLVVVERKKS